MPDLGITTKLPLGNVFQGEAVEFTPWLSDNLDRLASELGFELETEDIEVSVGAFKADIKARTTDGRTVIIENQFHNTDHSHLGQLLTYAAGLEADVVIWIAERVRDEHRAAVDWLNDKAADADFFAVEARAVQIDDSRPALFWDVVASPNTWSRATKQAHQTADLAPRQKLRIEFWTALNEVISESGESLTAYKPDKINWQGGTIGASDVWLNTSIGIQKKWVRVEIYLGGAKASERFKYLADHRTAIEQELGYELEWDPLEGKKACRISITLESSPSDQSSWPKQHDWIIQRRKDFERVFRPLVKDMP